jgi:hypothetical protein
MEAGATPLLIRQPVTASQLWPIHSQIERTRQTRDPRPESNRVATGRVGAAAKQVRVGGDNLRRGLTRTPRAVRFPGMAIDRRRCAFSRLHIALGARQEPPSVATPLEDVVGYRPRGPDSRAPALRRLRSSYQRRRASMAKSRPKSIRSGEATSEGPTVQDAEDSAVSRRLQRTDVDVWSDPLAASMPRRSSTGASCGSSPHLLLSADSTDTTRSRSGSSTEHPAGTQQLRDAFDIPAYQQHGR